MKEGGEGGRRMTWIDEENVFAPSKDFHFFYFFFLFYFFDFTHSNYCTHQYDF